MFWGLSKGASGVRVPPRIQAKTRELRERQARERDYAEIVEVGRWAEEEQPGDSPPLSPHLSPLHRHQHSDSLYTHASRSERPSSADRWVCGGGRGSWGG